MSMTDTKYMKYISIPEQNEAVQKAKSAFAKDFNNENKKKLKIVRSHFGSYVAFGMASYNLYHMKQKLIKQSIYLTRSKNSKLIKFTSFYLGAFYYVGLIGVWHIPSLAIQFSYNLYFATVSATINYLNPPIQTSEKLLLDDDIVQKTLREIQKI